MSVSGSIKSSPVPGLLTRHLTQMRIIGLAVIQTIVTVTVISACKRAGWIRYEYEGAFKTVTQHTREFLWQSITKTAYCLSFLISSGVLYAEVNGLKVQRPFLGHYLKVYLRLCSSSTPIPARLVAENERHLPVPASSSETTFNRIHLASIEFR